MPRSYRGAQPTITTTTTTANYASPTSCIGVVQVDVSGEQSTIEQAGVSFAQLGFFDGRSTIVPVDISDGRSTIVPVDISGEQSTIEQAGVSFAQLGLFDGRSTIEQAGVSFAQLGLFDGRSTIVPVDISDEQPAPSVFRGSFTNNGCTKGSEPNSIYW